MGGVRWGEEKKSTVFVFSAKYPWLELSGLGPACQADTQPDAARARDVIRGFQLGSYASLLILPSFLLALFFLCLFVSLSFITKELSLTCSLCVALFPVYSFMLSFQKRWDDVRISVRSMDDFSVLPQYYFFKPPPTHTHTHTHHNSATLMIFSMHDIFSSLIVVFFTASVLFSRFIFPNLTLSRELHPFSP